MKTKVTMALFLAVLLAASAVAQNGRYTRVRFARGRTTAILKGTLLKTEDVTHYALGARAGQTMIVHVTSPKNNAHLSVYQSGEARALEGAQEVKDWSGELPADSDYVITVQSTRGRANFTLEVTIR